MSTEPDNENKDNGVIGPEQQRALDSLRQVAGRETRRSLAVQQLTERLSKADPADVLEIAASQIRLLDEYHEIVLAQARKSFRLAAFMAVSGLVLFAFAVSQLLLQGANDAAIIAGIGGAVVEVVSGIGFYLYAKASGQLAEFQSRLDRTQRFLLANSICGSLKPAARDEARAELIRAVAGLSLLLPESERALRAESRQGGQEVEDA